MISLYKYQSEIFEKSKDMASYALFLETGTGKTIIALETMKWLYEQKKINAAIIAAPKTVLKPVWIQLLGDFYSGQFPFYMFQWIGTPNDYNLYQFDKFLNTTNHTEDKLFIFIVNIETFSHTLIYKRIKAILYKFKCLWIIDESTLIKSPKALRTKGILAISHLAEYKRILSGYPILRTPADLYSQLMFLGKNILGYSSFYSFRNEFCMMKQMDNRVSIFIAAKNTDKLQKIIQPISTRLLKSECLDLPDKVRTVRHIEMTPQQVRLYNDMKRQGYIQLKNNTKDFAVNLLVQLNKLHQIANGIIITQNLDITCYKYSHVIEILENEIPEQSCVIWSCYTKNIEGIYKWLIDNNISSGCIMGNTPIKERSDTIKKFTNKQLRVIVANPSTAQFGITLTAASYAIYFNNSFNLEHRIQSEDRLHRISQKNNVTYIDLVSAGTIEDKVLKKLEEKHNIGAQSLGDEWEAWFS